MGWFSFLITHCAKPYQRTLTGEPLLIKGLNFKGRRKRYISNSDIRYFLDGDNCMYRDGVSDFVVKLNEKAQRAVVGRLERVFKHIFVDEVQDFVGYDLDLLDLLLSSRVKLTLVGDPRQQILETNMGSKNKRYRGVGLIDWFNERSDICRLETNNNCYRCNQAICDFADAIFPDLPSTTSVDVEPTDHDGIFHVKNDEVERYIEKYKPVTVLRHNKNVDTKGLPAKNIGLAKGHTFDRVLIFPTQPMLKYLTDKDETQLKAPERLYVAVTRARFSVAFVVP